VYHPPYHPPTTVNYYGSSCNNCGGWSTGEAAAAGALVGMAVGTAKASANTNAATTSAYNAGVAAGSSNTTAAYTAGVATGATGTTTTTTTTIQTSSATGAIAAKLPPGAMSINKNGTTYYLSGNTWYQPAYGANGVYYRVVPAP
jgi:hypothetical protein